MPARPRQIAKITCSSFLPGTLLRILLISVATNPLITLSTSPNTRSNFKASWIFILAAIGSAAGLGNLWRFPYLAYEHGGAAFFVAYCLCMLAIGLPLLTMEIGMGQLTRKAAPMALGATDKKKRNKIIGWIAIFVAFFIATYYLVITSWTLSYAFSSFTLPWRHNSEAYFFDQFLNASGQISQLDQINLPVIGGIILILVLLYLFMFRGTAGISAVAKWLTPLPFIMLTILAANSMTLSGAESGIKAFVVPDWQSLRQTGLWFDAASQALFSLSLGFGIMIAYGAILHEKVNIRRVAVIIILGDTLAAFLGGLIIFAVLGHMAVAQQVPIASVVSQGVGLAFIVVPKALTLLPYGQSTFSVLFYLSLFLLAFTSIVSLFESILAATMDGTWRLRRPALLLLQCLLLLLFALMYCGNNGVYIIDIVDHYVSGYGIFTVCILEAIAIGWVYDAERLRYQLRKKSGVRLTALFNILLRFAVPITLILLLFKQLLADVDQAYGGYPVIYNAVFGTGVLAVLLIFALLFNRNMR